jgi:hypothetical protein
VEKRRAPGAERKQIRPNFLDGRSVFLRIKRFRRFKRFTHAAEASESYESTASGVVRHTADIAYIDGTGDGIDRTGRAGAGFRGQPVSRVSAGVRGRRRAAGR